VSADEGQQEITALLKPQKDQPLDSSKRPHFRTRKYVGKNWNAVVGPEMNMTAGEGQQQVTALIEKRGVHTKYELTYSRPSIGVFCPHVWAEVR
jgi:hypothetical protein